MLPKEFRLRGLKLWKMHTCIPSGPVMTRPALRKTRNSIRRKREDEEPSINPVEVDRIEGIYKGLVGRDLHLF